MSTFDEDIRYMKRQVSAEVIFEINSNPKLYKWVDRSSIKAFKASCYEWAEDHENEFGTVFQAELDVLSSHDWGKIMRHY